MPQAAPADVLVARGRQPTQVPTPPKSETRHRQALVNRRALLTCAAAVNVQISITQPHASLELVALSRSTSANWRLL